MGPNALTSLADGLPKDHSPVVLSRENGAWGPATSALRGGGPRARGGSLSLRSDAERLRRGPGRRRQRHSSSRARRVGWRAQPLVPLDPSIGDDALRRVLESTGAVHAVASDERQLARILALRPDLPALDLVLLMAAAPSDRKPPALLVTAALESRCRASQGRSRMPLARPSRMTSESLRVCWSTREVRAGRSAATRSRHSRGGSQKRSVSLRGTTVLDRASGRRGRASRGGPRRA